MTVHEIYSTLSDQMLQGVMLHEEFADYYAFLGLCGYKKFHERRYKLESEGYRKLHRYFIEHHNHLIKRPTVVRDDIIPADWYNHSRFDVDVSTLRMAVKTGMEKWVGWERSTKMLMEQMHGELMQIGEVASAMFLKEMICEVDEELREAEEYWMNKKLSDYSIESIMADQEKRW